MTTYEGIEATVTVEALGLSMPMAELYEGVNLPPAQPNWSAGIN